MAEKHAFSVPYRLFVAIAEILGAFERYHREEHNRHEAHARRAAFPWPDPETLGTEARAQLADAFAALHLRTTAQALDPGVVGRKLRRPYSRPAGEPVGPLAGDGPEIPPWSPPAAAPAPPARPGPPGTRRPSKSWSGSRARGARP